MFESANSVVLQRWKFIIRLLRHIGFALALVLLSLLAGVLGYREFESMSWTDALLNAAMILGGMGPVDPLHTESGKLFAACYALYSGIVFLATVAIVLAPMAHRMLHRFHAEN